MSRRTTSVALGVLAAAAVAAAGLASSQSGTGTADAADPVERPTVRVENRDLVLDYEAVGRLAPAVSLDVGSPASGTLVWVAELGAEVSAGSTLAVVDDQPVVVLEGATPAWRPLRVGDEGPDVEQLEAALVGAGFDPEGNITVDEEFTAATASMVEDWQESLGAEPTGIMPQAAAVYIESPMRVESVSFDVGAAVADGDVIVGLASFDKVAAADVPVPDTLDLAIGDAVLVELPDRTTLQGNVESITAGANPSTGTAIVGFEAPERVIGLGGIEVDLSWSEVVALDVPTLPAEAFRHLDDGTYVIDIVADGGIDVLVVEPGRQVGSRVEVSGVPVDAHVVSL